MSRDHPLPDQSVIAVDCLTKQYGSFRALNDTSFSVKSGQLMGFLGPNGAGKTTTIRILMGLMRSTAGACRVFGADSWNNAARLHARIGYLPGDVRLYRDLTGQQTVQMVSRARRADCAAETERLADALRLDLKTRVRGYSTGMRQKLGLILALMHRPELLILDEPTTSLDPLIQQVVYRELHAVVNEGRTVLFSSHSLKEVEDLCENVIILRDGRVVAATSIAELKRRAGRRVVVRRRESSNAASPPTGLDVDQHEDGVIAGRWSGPMGPLLKWLATISPQDVVIQPPDLEDVFLAYYHEGGTQR